MRHYPLLLCLSLLTACGGGGGGASSPALPQTALPQAQNSASVYVALGDSITYGENLPSRQTQAYPYLVSPTVVDLGVDGQTAASAQTSELPYMPATATVATIFFGTNDLSAGSTPQQFIANLQAVILGVQRTAPKARIVLINVPHYPAAATQWQGAPAYNAALGGFGLPVIDLYDDNAYTADLACCAVGAHPSPAGQAELARLVTLALAP